LNFEPPVVFDAEASLAGAGIFALLAVASVLAGAYYGTWILFALWGLAASFSIVAYNCLLHVRRSFDGQTYTWEVTCFGRPVRRRQEPIAFYALRQVCFEGQEARALMLVDRFRPEVEEHLLDACTTDAEAEAFAAALGIELVDAEWSEEVDPSKGPVPPQLAVSRSEQGLSLEVRVPVWLRWNRRLALVAGVCFIVGLVPEAELWGEYVSAPAFVVLIAVTLVHLVTLYSSRYQYVRDERLLWGDGTVTCTRRRGGWRSPVSEIDGVDLMELGEKRSKLPVKRPPTWYEYQVNVTVKDSVVECFRSSDKSLVEWVAGKLQAEHEARATSPVTDHEGDHG
jgi:hypothetical protein